MKTTVKIILASFVLILASCEKDEMYEPIEDINAVDEPVKATASIAPKLSLQIRLRTKIAPYSWLRNNCTVRLSGNFYTVSSESSTSGTISSIWSSPNGSDWTLRRNNAFPMNVMNMFTYDEKIWALGTSGFSGQIEIYNSRNGYSWSRVSTTLNFPINYLDNAVVFRNKMFVFESNSSESSQKIHSSSDGINWTLENSNPFPQRGHGATIVFKDTLYYLGGVIGYAGPTNEIWKSTDGRNWSQVSDANASIIRPTENFPEKASFAAVVHKNAVWVTGGSPTGPHDDVTKSKEIWVSGDMQNWEKYAGQVPFQPITIPTLLSHKNEMVLLGGLDHSPGARRNVRSIWSIKPKSRAWVPVEIPRPKLPPL